MRSRRRGAAGAISQLYGRRIFGAPAPGRMTMIALLDLAVTGAFVTWLGCLLVLLPLGRFAGLARR